MKSEHKAFYRDVLSSLEKEDLAVFAGAGASVSAGYVNWKELLKDICEDLKLDIEKEHDLVSITQYHINKAGGRSKVNQLIMDEFDVVSSPTENHKILSRLPIHTYWTTNYDDLIEKALEGSQMIYDCKKSIENIPLSKRNRSATIYKMHGDKGDPSKAIITKDDYESYFMTHSPFVDALKADLSSKMFLFLGFSFTDPNLDYILSRVRLQLNENSRHHYFFVKKLEEKDCEDKADFEYQLRKQELFVADLTRKQLHPVWVDSYAEITVILQEIEELYKKKTIFISGSAEEFGDWDRNKGQTFIHKLSKELIKEGFRIVNGFGWGIGSAVINGALEAVYENPLKYSEENLVVKPFPQYSTGKKELPELWKEYRKRMLQFAGISLFIFGNKLKDGEIINADGVEKEYKIAQEFGQLLIPVKGTGYMSSVLSDSALNDEWTKSSYDKIRNDLQELSQETDADKIVKKLVQILKSINK